MGAEPSQRTRARRLAKRRRQVQRRRATAAGLAAVAVAFAVWFAALRGTHDAGAEDLGTRRAAPALPAAAQRPAAAPADAVVRLSAVGDVTLGWDAARPSGDGSSLIAGAKPHLVGDVVLGNLETALTSRGSGKCGAGRTDCYSFRAPPAFAGGLRRTGFTILNLANNHANDYGAEGRNDTVAALRAAGLRMTGRPSEIALVKVGPVRVAIVGFSPDPWSQSALDLAGARALVRRADGLADLVVVTGHLGAEGKEHTHVKPGVEVFLGDRRGDPIAFAHATIDAGADLVALHGPHVLRALEWYRGRLVAYSLGNFSGYGNLNTNGPGGISAVLQVALRADGRLAEARLAPLRLVGKGAPVGDPSGAALGIVRSLSRADMRGRAPRITAAGAILPS